MQRAATGPPTPSPPRLPRTPAGDEIEMTQTSRVGQPRPGPSNV